MVARLTVVMEQVLLHRPTQSVANITAFTIRTAGRNLKTNKTYLVQEFSLACPTASTAGKSKKP